VGFEPTNGGFADSPWKRILLMRLAFTSALMARFRPYSAAIVPKLTPAVVPHPKRAALSVGVTTKNSNSIAASIQLNC
jgi:hypothetical protein